MLEIREVNSIRLNRAFVKLPAELYGNDPFWVPPLWTEERKGYTQKNNAILANAEFTRYLAFRDGRPVGRILPYVDKAFNAHFRDTMGFFGSFECEDNAETAARLFEAAENWIRERNCRGIRGPVNPIAENWGFLSSCFDDSPVFLTPYNPPWYHDFMSRGGYSPVKKLLAYQGSSPGGYTIPERFTRFYKKALEKRPELTLRRIRLGRKLMEDASAIWRITNIALEDNWGYVPVDEQVFKETVRRLKTILEPDAVWFVEDRGVPVGFALGYPDINVIIREIRGRLFPFGFIRLLAGKKKIKRYRLYALAVLPEYFNLGLDVLLYMSLYNALRPKGIILEANYILEDNPRIRNALEKLGLEKVKEYLIYEKSLRNH